MLSLENFNSTIQNADVELELNFLTHLFHTLSLYLESGYGYGTVILASELRIMEVP